MNKVLPINNSSGSGVLYGLSAYILWGFLPLYWKLLGEIPAIEILAHRIVWSFVFVMGIVMVQGHWNTFKMAILDKKILIPILCSSIFITINWGLFIWAVNSDRVVESSMGYYINPLIIIFLGMVVLKEKLNKWQGISLILAAMGVLNITIQYGKVPWVALTLALSFAFYGLLKKLVQVGSIVGLAIETTLLTPMALVYIIYKQVNGTGALGTISIGTTLLLACAGIATATPLLLFAKGARRVPLSTMGFLQYIAPSITLIIGIFVFKEQFTTSHFISFGFIWGGLLIYSFSQTKWMKRIQQKYFIKATGEDEIKG